MYRARDTLLQRDVAIKLLLTASSAADRERFFREARATARLHHPNIVTIYDAGEDRNGLYLVLEFVDGVSLASVIGCEIAADRAVAIVAQVMSALTAAHSAGIVHRDIKPANILVTAGDQVKVADFGIARIAGESPLTVAGGVVGTPRYMAPEQIEGGEVTAAADIFALGVVAYQMLSGTLPFRGDSFSEFAANVARGRWVRVPAETVARAPQLWRTIEHMLQSDPVRRPTAEELLVMLGGKPAPRSRRPLVSAAFLVAVAIVAGGFYFARWHSEPPTAPIPHARVHLAHATTADVIAAIRSPNLPGGPVRVHAVDKTNIDIEAPQPDLARAVTSAQIIDALAGYRFAVEPNLFVGPTASTRRISSSGSFVVGDFLFLIARAAKWPLVQDVSVKKIARAVVAVEAQDAPWDEVVLSLINSLDLSLWRDGNVWIVESQQRRRERERSLPRMWISFRMDNRKDTAVVATALRPLLSERGAVAVLPPRDRLVVFDTSERVNEIRRVVSEMDRTPSDVRAQAGQTVYRGEPISMNLHDADVVDMIKTFGELTGVSFVIDPTVRGTVSLNFADVPWDNAFHAILQSQGLAYTKEGQVFRIAPETKQLNGPAVVESIHLAHVKPTFFHSFADAVKPEIEIVLTDDASSTIVLRGTKASVAAQIANFRNIDALNAPPK